ncbi:hypothetical protein D3C85_807250 [compost metagenome]
MLLKEIYQEDQIIQLMPSFRSSAVHITITKKNTFSILISGPMHPQDLVVITGGPFFHHFLLPG